MVGYSTYISFVDVSLANFMNQYEMLVDIKSCNNGY